MILIEFSDSTHQDIFNNFRLLNDKQACQALSRLLFVFIFIIFTINQQFVINHPILYTGSELIKSCISQTRCAHNHTHDIANLPTEFRQFSNHQILEWESGLTSLEEYYSTLSSSLFLIKKKFKITGTEIWIIPQ